MDDVEKRARARYEAETDPVQREAYALAKRAGFDWYNTESSARRMAEHAADEILALRAPAPGTMTKNELLEAAKGVLRFRAGNLQSPEGWVNFEGSDEEWEKIQAAAWDRLDKAIGSADQSGAKS